MHCFHACEVRPVTFGSVLTKFGVELKAVLIKNDEIY